MSSFHSTTFSNFSKKSAKGAAVWLALGQTRPCPSCHRWHMPSATGPRHSRGKRGEESPLKTLASEAPSRTRHSCSRPCSRTGSCWPPRPPLHRTRRPGAGGLQDRLRSARSHRPRQRPAPTPDAAVAAARKVDALACVSATLSRQRGGGGALTQVRTSEIANVGEGGPKRRRAAAQRHPPPNKGRCQIRDERPIISEHFHRVCLRKNFPSEGMNCAYLHGSWRGSPDLKT